MGAKWSRNGGRSETKLHMAPPPLHLRLHPSARLNRLWLLWSSTWVWDFYGAQVGLETVPTVQCETYTKSGTLTLRSSNWVWDLYGAHVVVSSPSSVSQKSQTQPEILRSLALNLSSTQVLNICLSSTRSSSNVRDLCGAQAQAAVSVGWWWIMAGRQIFTWRNTQTDEFMKKYSKKYTDKYNTGKYNIRSRAVCLHARGSLLNPLPLTNNKYEKKILTALYFFVKY